MTNRGGRPAKLTRAQLEAVRRHYADGITAKAIAQVYGVARSTISRYLRGECRQYENARNN